MTGHNVLRILTLLIAPFFLFHSSLVEADPNEQLSPMGIDPPHLLLGGMSSCDFCHVDYLNKPEPLTEDWISFTKCMSCHTDGGSATPADVHVVSGDTIWCENCHDPHHHQDIWPHKYIKSQIETPAGYTMTVVFADSLDFVHGDPAYDGICEICHTETAYHRDDSTGDHSHNLGTDCMVCHAHTAGFQGGCTSCHGTQGVNAAPPVDIWADDQGINGDDVGQLWNGFINIARPDPESSGGCRWLSQPGDEMLDEDQMTYVGDNRGNNDVPGAANNTIFKGLIDWVNWKPVADYSGVDDPPN